MYKYPYLLIKNRLESIPELKLIEINLGQDTKQFKGGLTQTPMVLISFRPLNTDSLGKKRQIGVLEFELKLITSVSHSSDKRLTENKPLEHFELFDKIYNTIHGWAGNLKQLPNIDESEKVLGSCQRTFVDYADTHTDKMSSTQRFKSTVTDIGKIMAYTKVNPDLAIDSSSDKIKRIINGSTASISFEMDNATITKGIAPFITIAGSESKILFTASDAIPTIGNSNIVLAGTQANFAFIANDASLNIGGEPILINGTESQMSFLATDATLSIGGEPITISGTEASISFISDNASLIIEGEPIFITSTQAILSLLANDANITVGGEPVSIEGTESNVNFTAQNGVLIAGTLAPVELGNIWTDTNLVSTDYQVNGGATKTFNAGNLELSNGSASFNDWVKVIGLLPKYRYHNLELWKQTIEFTTPASITSTTYGLGMGVLALGEALHNRTRVGLDTNASFQNKLTLYDNSDFTRQVTSVGSFAFQTSTKYWLEFERNKDQYLLNVYNSADKTNQLASLTVSPTNGYANTAFLWHNVGEWALNFFGGTSIVHSWSIDIPAKKNVDILWIGDSNTVGFKAGLANRYINRYNADLGLDENNQTVLAGVGDRIAQISLMQDLIAEINASKIYLVIGVNDRRQGRTEQQTMNDWTALADAIRANNTGQFICVSPPAANSVDMTFLDTHIQNYATTHSLEFVSLFQATKGAATTNIEATYDVGDGLHYNAAGHQAMADILKPALAPNNLSLSSNNIDENTTGVVGTLSANGNPTPTFAITGGANQVDFSLSGNNLILDNAKDYETITSLQVEITATNSEGTHIVTFTININDAVESNSSALFNFNASAQNITGYNDVSGNPHTAVRSATDAATGFGVRNSGTWNSFGGGSSNNTGGENVDDGGGFYYGANVQRSIWYSYLGDNYSPKTQLEFFGLDSAKTYTIRILVTLDTGLASSTSDEQRWAINGVTQQVQANGNTSTIMEWTGVTPNVNGEVIAEGELLILAADTFFCPAVAEVLEE